VAPSGEIATWAWVRACPLKIPVRKRSQFGQLQFHWGNPPPAAEPRTLIRIYRLELSVRVGADFTVQFNYFVLRHGPFHGFAPVIGFCHSNRAQFQAQKV
jgi:hypothetical protein